jgi:hypothetical protein
MEISNPIKERDIVDYDFMFTSGAKLAISVEEAAGDQVAEQPDRYVFNLASKPSITDPSELTDEETMEVFKLGLAAVCKCRRKQRMPTEDELFDMHATLHAMAKRVQ